jgi:hypothetical protein
VNHVFMTGPPYGETIRAWPGPGLPGAAVFDLTGDAEQPARPVLGAGAAALPALQVEQFLFTHVPVRWADWVQTWGPDQPGKGNESLLAPEVRLLPGSNG